VHRDTGEPASSRPDPGQPRMIRSVQNSPLVSESLVVVPPVAVPPRQGEAGRQASGDAAPKVLARRRGGPAVAVVLAAGLLAGALLTHFAAGSGRLSSEDKALMGMQRMGPPPTLQAAYHELNADTVAIRSSVAGPVIAVGIFAGKFAESIPGRGIKHFIQAITTPYFAVFVSPLSRIRSPRVFVDFGGQKLPGYVILTDRRLGLAAIKVPTWNDQLLIGPPPFIGAPAGVIRIPETVLRLVPGDNGSTGYALTGALLSGTGASVCNDHVSPGEAGAPLGAMSIHGAVIVIGLAVPSAEHGRCSILGGWAVNEFMRRVALILEPAWGG
jgi:hypothetical protein